MRAQRIGRYEVLAEVSRGGMGIVYRARDPLIDRIVAIKTIGMGMSRQESEVFDKRFDLEARSAGGLNHPNIVTIHDMGRSDDGAYIAMEFLEGRSLRDILDSGVVLEPARVAQIAVQIADGLAYAHEHGVIHCDIKPANIVLLTSGRVKITDFGIARLPTGSRTFTGQVVGSPRYISPEQILGRKVDARSDVFSLGAVLYEMLTGVPPFGGGELDEILFQVINDNPQPPSHRNAAIPAAFDAITERALAKAPADRYASATQMAADLRKLAPAHPIVAPQQQPGEPRARPPSSDTTTTVLIGGAELPPDVVLSAPSKTPHRRRDLAVVVLAVAVVAVGLWGLLDGGPPKGERAAEAAVAPEPSIASAAEATQAAAANDVAVTPTVIEPAQPAAAPAPEKPVAKAPARVVLAVSPWGEVFVDGRRRGVSPPLAELRVTPGRHTIEIRNTTFATYRETIDVLPDANIRIKHKFE
jgi:serine/threonine-protein kinase